MQDHGWLCHPDRICVLQFVSALQPRTTLYSYIWHTLLITLSHPCAHVHNVWIPASKMFMIHYCIFKRGQE